MGGLHVIRSMKSPSPILLGRKIFRPYMIVVIVRSPPVGLMGIRLPDERRQMRIFDIFSKASDQFQHLAARSIPMACQVAVDNHAVATAPAPAVDANRFARVFGRHVISHPPRFWQFA